MSTPILNCRKYDDVITNIIQTSSTIQTALSVILLLVVFASGLNTLKSTDLRRKGLA
jgi:hypothetical protein